MSVDDFGRELSERGGGRARGRLSPARLRLLRLRRLIRLRRKLRRARQATPIARVPSRAPRASLLGLVMLFALGAVVAAGCGWFGTEHSVRFNYWHGERQFSRLPPLPFDARARTKPDYRQEDEEENAAPAEDPDEQEAALWARAEAEAQRGDFAGLRKSLDEYLEVTGVDGCAGYYVAAARCRRRRNSAHDRLDALDSHARGANARALSAYLKARSAYDDWRGVGDDAGVEKRSPSGESIASAATLSPAAALELAEGALDTVPQDAGLEDNVAYLRADLLGARDGWARSVEAFERLAARYPRSEKREAALFNVGRLWMRSGAELLGVEHASAEDACAACKDEAWRKAVAAFERVLREHPRGRYAADARGWLAFLHVRVGERAEGLAEYYRMLADETNVTARAEAVRSLRLVRDDTSEEEMARVESLLETEPRVALAYAYHEIYNAALGFGIDVEVSEDENPYRYCMEREPSDKCYTDFYQWQEKERERRSRDAGHKALARVAGFATRQLKRQTGDAVGGGFALRVAQADLELDEDKAARELASRALSVGLAGNERASALWVRGVAEYRLKDFGAARRTFTTLLAEFPEGDLTEGARRHAAMAAEEMGDLDAALEQYLALEYTEDAAYFVDVLMTPEQLASFAARHEDSPARDMLYYSLGVRYLRAHRFDEARAAYARVRTAAEDGANPYGGDDECDETYPPPRCTDSKNMRWEEWKGVHAAWVLRDLQTMGEMEHLEERSRKASGDEAKAEALYQLASYLYASSELAFYNPAAWRGGRFYVFYYDQQFRAPGEAAVMRRYMEEHEPLVRALRVYLQVAEEYPRTRAARDSLYTAAVIHERLAGFELYWPGQYKQGLYPGARLVSYEDVRRTYPDYPLPAGTYGWEPSTRTVNGHAAWPAPPRPPQLTGMERARLRIGRAERRVGQAWELFGEVYGGRLRAWTIKGARWAVVALFAGLVLAVFRRTRRARRFLYRRLMRARKSAAARRAREPYGPKLSYAAPGVTGAGLRDAAGQTARALLRLALNERGRAALALNLFTHGLLTVLLWAMLWAAR
jgi:outer membrane protein assembly factor BamD (BamD/ComL family)